MSDRAVRAAGDTCRRGRRARRRGAVLGCALGVLAFAATACGSTTSGVAPTVAVVLPPGQSLPGSGGTWATLAMGRFGDPVDTFGEVFYRTGCSGSGCTPGPWALATPPGVASNGGLMVAANPDGGLTAGFGASIALTFSPLAETAAAGTVWNGGILPAGLLPVADSLAASGPTQRLALVSTAGGTVLASGRDLDTWVRLATAADVTPAASAAGCTLGALDAVAVSPAGNDLVAATCTGGGRAGVFRLGTVGHPRTVTDVGPRVAGAAATVRVERLVTTASGLAALLRTGSGRGIRLSLATSVDDGATWTVSPATATGGRSVRSTAVTPSGGFAVVLASGGAATALEEVTPAAGWRSLPTPPPATSVVAARPGGGYDALVPAGVQLDVFTLAGTGSRWTRTQVVDVPLQYGSSG